MLNLKEKIPVTLNEAIKLLVDSMDETEKKFIKENDSGVIHHSTGMNVRNNWGLWQPDSPIVNDIKTRFKLFGHGDDCSGLIFAGVWASIRGQDIDAALKKEADSYRKHWKRSGLDPETGIEINKGRKLLYHHSN